MENKIIGVNEIDERAAQLVNLSGYCLINLLDNRLTKYDLPISDETLIDLEFCAYDYDERNKRPDNHQYVECADECVRRMK